MGAERSQFVFTTPEEFVEFFRAAPLRTILGHTVVHRSDQSPDDRPVSLRIDMLVRHVEHVATVHGFINAKQAQAFAVGQGVHYLNVDDQASGKGSPDKDLLDLSEQLTKGPASQDLLEKMLSTGRSSNIVIKVDPDGTEILCRGYDLPGPLAVLSSEWGNTMLGILHELLDCPVAMRGAAILSDAIMMAGTSVRVQITHGPGGRTIVALRRTD